ncbi:MAG: hypothetical protein HYS18_07630 [Burkholderiales bacterium]|nr:hypothetical protein [Burkholderiales bacterium]
MLASELIEKLEILIAEHGDLPVALYDWNEAYAPPAESTSVTYEDGQFCVDAD